MTQSKVVSDSCIKMWDFHVHVPWLFWSRLNRDTGPWCLNGIKSLQPGSTSGGKPEIRGVEAVIAAVHILLAMHCSCPRVSDWVETTSRAHFIFVKYEAAVDVGLWLHLRKRSLCEENCMTSDLCLPEYLRTGIRCLLICPFFSQTDRDSQTLSAEIHPAWQTTWNNHS